MQFMLIHIKSQIKDPVLLICTGEENGVWKTKEGEKHGNFMGKLMCLCR